jgi:hypothetical protein
VKAQFSPDFFFFVLSRGKLPKEPKFGLGYFLNLCKLTVPQRCAIILKVLTRGDDRHDAADEECCKCAWCRRCFYNQNPMIPGI